jgi:DNA-binding CsgD family transcriptional regulator/tetratricopeptide (TPR) repeat protein
MTQQPAYGMLGASFPGIAAHIGSKEASHQREMMELVDRATPFRELTEAWHAASAAGCFVLVAGEAGIGKTSLVGQFLRQQAQGARILEGACDALFTPRPLGPIHDIALQTEGELARLLAEDANPRQLFAAFLAELQEAPSIVVIEDLHWADEATLDLLKYVGRRVHQTRSLLLGSFRDDELGPQHPLRLLLGDLATSPAVRRVSLTPLSVEGVHQLIAGRPLDAASLHRQTGGNPFYVTEVLAAGQDDLPATIRDAVLARAARLSLSGRAVLDAAAVIGPRIEPWLLAAITRAEASAVNESLDSGMLRAQGNLLVFRHELARLVILEAISPHQRLFLHRAVLDELKASRLTQHDVTRLAHHAEAAGDSEAILTYAPAAAEAAQAAGMLRAAAELWKLAIRYSDELPPQQTATFYAALGAAYKENPDRSQAIRSYQQAITMATMGGDLLVAGNSLSRMAVMLLMEGRIAESIAAVEEALGLLEAVGPSPPLAAAQKTRAFLHLINGENEQAVFHAHRCLEVASRLESIPLHIEAYHALGLCSLPLHHQQGCDYLEQSLSLVLEEKAYWAAGSVFADLLMTCVDVYRLQRAEELVAGGLQITTEYDHDLSRLVIEAWKAILLVYRGRWSEAEAISSAIVEGPYRLSAIRVPALVALGRLYARRGLPGAEELLDEALELSQQVKNDQRLGVVYTARAETAWTAGHAESARREACGIYQLTIENKQPGFAAELAYWRWLSGEAVETYDWMVQPFVLEIQGNWRAAAALWDELGCPYERARALAQGNSEAQREALLIFEQLGARPMAERVRAQLRAAGVQTIPRGPRTATRQNPFGLTNRQVEILSLLAKNLTNAEIAARLHISPKTVDHHVSAVLGKLDVSTRDQAALLARQHPDFPGHN